MPSEDGWTYSEGPAAPKTPVAQDTDWSYETTTPAAPKKTAPVRKANLKAFQDRDLMSEIEGKHPGIGFTSGFRDEKYQQSLKDRGYKPAANSLHKSGDSVDISSFPGMSLAQGAASLRKQFPDAKITYGDKNHLDHVHFDAPGYGAFPALGGAVGAGVVNPRLQEEDGWDYGDSSPVEEGVTSAPPAKVNQPELIGGLPKGTEIEFNVDADANQAYNRDDFLATQGINSNQEARIIALYNENRGNKTLTKEALKKAQEAIAPGTVVEIPDEIIKQLHDGNVSFGGLDSTEHEAEYRDKLQKRADDLDTVNETGNLEALADQGFALNLSDEAKGVGGAIAAGLSGENVVEGYTLDRDAERQRLEQAREEEGGLGTAVEIAASLPTGILLPFAKAKSIGDLAKGGAAAGAAYGFGRGDGLGDSLGSAATDAGIGALAGPVVDKALRTVAPPVAKKLREALAKRNAAPKEVVEEAAPSGVSAVKDLTPEDKLVEALKTAKPLRKEQDVLISKIRSERIAEVVKTQKTSSGESGFFAELKALKGEIPKVQAKSIRDKFTQDDVDVLFNKVKDTEGLSAFEQINARVGLAKILGEEGLSVPTPTELALLSKILSPETVKNLTRLKPAKGKIKDFLDNAINLPRSLMSTLDLSAPLRQGVFMVGRKEFYKSFVEMFKSFKSEKAYKGLMDDINNRPNSPLMREYKLALTELDGDLSKREEDFMSNWAEKIPVAGRAIRASNRAYTGFLNKIRADVFDDILTKSDELGNSLRDSPKAMKDLTSFINNATGRGSLGGLETSAPLLNGLFFSPRLISSRVSMLNPAFYAKLDPVVRKEAVKSLMSFGGLATSLLTLASYGGADVETDPRSSNFAKIKTGDTRYDILGGFQQYLKLGAILASGEKKSGKGDIQTLGKGYKADTRLDVLYKFAETKLSPPASYVAGLLKGKDFLGEPFDPVSEAAQRFIPLFLQDVAEAYEEGGVVGAAKVTPGMFGVGVATYPTPTDDLGNEASINNEDEPIYKELEALSEFNGKPVIGRPTKKGFDTPEAYEEYVKASGTLIKEEIQSRMEDADWQGFSPEEKIAEIKEIKAEARKEVREELLDIKEQNLTPAPSGKDEGWVYE